MFVEYIAVYCMVFSLPYVRMYLDCLTNAKLNNNSKHTTLMQILVILFDLLSFWYRFAISSTKEHSRKKNDARDATAIKLNNIRFYYPFTQCSMIKNVFYLLRFTFAVLLLCKCQYRESA